MKRRVMIAKALAHEPDILFLDEPTAGVDVELRRDMWALVRRLRDSGTTIILTTHYIEEAEEMADRVGVINKGELILVEEKDALMQKLGRKDAPPAARRAARRSSRRARRMGPRRCSDEGRDPDLRVRRQGRAHRHPLAARARCATLGIAFKDLDTKQVEPRGHFRRAWSTSSERKERSGMNWRGVWAIYKFEMHRFRRTLWTGLAVPVITTSLYFIVFGAAIGSRMTEIDGIPYGAFIVPGLMMLSLFTESIFNASFGIHMPRFTGTIYEILSAPLSAFETVLGYVGAAATKAMSVGAGHPRHRASVRRRPGRAPGADAALSCCWSRVTFCLFGFIVGIWAKGFEQLQVIPLLIVTPLTFLGGAFYSIDMLAEPWRTITLFNPVVYLINGFRWTFFGTADVAFGDQPRPRPSPSSSPASAGVWWIFRTGYRLKQ